MYDALCKNENGGINEGAYFDFNTKKLIPMLKIRMSCWNQNIKIKKQIPIPIRMGMEIGWMDELSITICI